MFNQLIRRELNQPWLSRDLFENFEPFLTKGNGYAFPRIDLHQNENNIILTAELPGIKAEDLDISVQDKVITLRGKREQSDLKKGESWLHQEQSYGEFSRSFRLPYRIDSEKVDAKLKDGVLTLTLPKSEESQTKQIQIKS